LCVYCRCANDLKKVYNFLLKLMAIFLKEKPLSHYEMLFGFRLCLVNDTRRFL